MLFFFTLRTIHRNYEWKWSHRKWWAVRRPTPFYRVDATRDHTGVRTMIFSVRIRLDHFVDWLIDCLWTIWICLIIISGSEWESARKRERVMEWCMCVITLLYFAQEWMLCTCNCYCLQIVMRGLYQLHCVCVPFGTMRCSCYLFHLYELLIACNHERIRGVPFTEHCKNGQAQC